MMSTCPSGHQMLAGCAVVVERETVLAGESR